MQLVLEFYIPDREQERFWFVPLLFVTRKTDFLASRHKHAPLYKRSARINVPCSRTTMQCRRWGSNPRPLGFQSSNLPLSHCASLPCGPWARHIYPSLVLVQPRKTRPCLTERLLMGRKESNQTGKKIIFFLTSADYIFWCICIVVVALGVRAT